MSKLYEARDNNLIKPLIGSEVGYAFKSSHINKVIEDINIGKYGSYLIGGVVGTGKSSLVDIATAFTKRDTFVIRVNFYNEYECVEKFPVILLEKIIETVKESDLLNKVDGLKELIWLCEEKIKNNIHVEGKLEKNRNSKKSKSETYKAFLLAQMGMAVERFIKSQIQLEASVAGERKRSREENVAYAETVTMTKIQRDWLKDIEEILSMLQSQNVVIIYDELDKMDDDVLVELFKRYKAVFVERNIFHYFLVNDEIFRRYSESDLLRNSVYTYFVGMYYISLLSFEETLQYSKMMFAEEDYLSGLVTYYMSMGNYRLINMRYLSPVGYSLLDVFKAYVLKKVYDKLNQFYLDCCTRDSLIRKIKASIEAVIRKRNFAISELAKKLLQIGYKDDEWPQYDEIIKVIIETIEELFPGAVEKSDERICVVCENLLYGQVMDVVLEDRREDISKGENRNIQLSDLYAGVKKGEKLYVHGIDWLRDEILPLKVADNSSDAYKDSLINILHANLYERAVQVIILKRPRTKSETLYLNDYAYTGIIVVNKGTFQIAYYVDQGSYEYEYGSAVEGLIDEAEQLGVKVKEITIDKRLDLEREIQQIVVRYNNV